MKKSLVLSLCLLCALALCACGDTAASQDNTAYVGNYVCTGITMDGLTMNPEGNGWSCMLTVRPPPSSPPPPTRPSGSCLGRPSP